MYFCAKRLMPFADSGFDFSLRFHGLGWICNEILAIG